MQAPSQADYVMAYFTLSSLDKSQGGSALEQNRPLVETWRCAQPRDYPTGH